MTGASNEDFGRIAYDAYCESVEYVSHYTKEGLPDWESMAKPVQEAWCAAANAVLGHLMLLERGRP